MDFVLEIAPKLLDFANVALASILVILAFSLLAYTLTYNFRDPVAHWFALLLACVMVTYASEVALDRVLTADSANRWLRLQWLGIAHAARGLLSVFAGSVAHDELSGAPPALDRSGHPRAVGGAAR